MWGRVDLLRATYAFGRELELRGAVVTVLKLPVPLKLDDYLVAHPVDEFARLRRLTLKEAPLSSMGTWWKDWHRRRAHPPLPKTVGAGPYVVHHGRLCHRRETKDGPVLDALANFTAMIREEFVLDDGVETTRAFLLEGRLETGQPLPLVRVPAARFAGMTWVTDAWGMRAVVRAGFSTRDALREAIQVLSPAARSRHIYTHTGWRELEGRWAYLHATGAIGATDCEVDLGADLAQYHLPATAEDPVSAFRASLDLLRSNIAPASVMVPLWASIYRAPTVSALPADVSLWLEGTTGSLKSTLAALALAHYGPFDRLTLPGAWASTANALERRAFLLKDVLFVIDDYAPGALDAKEYELKAARILRAAGNRAGRGRLRADLSERPAYPPRGLILATGESRPPGQSLLARTLVLEMDRGEIDLDALGRAQAQVARLPHALAAYVTWLAPQMPTLRDTLAEAFARARQRAMADDAHLRLPEAVAHLYLGFDLGLACAQELGACSEAEGDELRAKAWATLTALSTAQGALIVSEKPTHRFLRVVATLVAQGRAVLLDREPGDGPVPYRADLLGWQDTEGLYLLPEAAWHAVTKFCRESGEPFPLREVRLRHDLEQEGIAETEPGRRTTTVRVAGKTRRVIQISRLVAEELLDEPFSAAPITTITGITGPER